MDAIIAQVHALAKEADQATRKSIQNALEGLLLEVQGPLDLTVHLLNSVVCLLLCNGHVLMLAPSPSDSPWPAWASISSSSRLSAAAIHLDQSVVLQTS